MQITNLIAEQLNLIRSNEESLEINLRKSIMKEIDHDLNTSISDLIIMDIGLPDISGDQLLLKIRGNNYLKNIPVIINSAYVSDTFIERVKEIGANEYISKPFKVKEFIDVVKKYLDN